jgi:superfamily I DNA and/or RNA helicase
MHPMIRAFPSRTFYENRITDDSSISQRVLDPMLQAMSNVFQPLVFFDLVNSQESQEETSKTNREEASFTLNLIQHLYVNFAKSDQS